MSQIIEVPGHGQVEFPDGMSDDQMSSAIKKNFYSESSQSAQPATSSTVESSMPNSPPTSKFMTGITAFNHGVEQLTGGIEYNIAKGFGLENHVSDYMSKKEQEFQDLKKINPVTAAIGDAVGKIGALLPLSAMFGTSAMGLMAGGAVTAAVQKGAQYDPAFQDKSQIDRIKDVGSAAIVGAGTSLLLGKGGEYVGKGLQALGNVIKGSKLLFKSADDVVNDAINQTVAKGTNATAAGALTTFNDTLQKMKAQKDDLYGIRDQIAKDNNIMAKFDNVKQVLTAKDSFLDPKVSSFVNQILSSSGNNKSGVSYSVMQTLISKVGKMANSAGMQGKADIQSDYLKVVNALVKDSDAGVSGNVPLESAQSIANTFYKNSYAPLKTVATKEKLVDNFVNENFVNNMIQKTATDPNYSKAFQLLGDKGKQTFVAAHLNALKAAKTDAADNFMVGAYANTLKKELDQIPALKGIGSDMQKLADITAAFSAAQKVTGGQATKFLVGSMAGDMLGGGGVLTAVTSGGLALAKLGFLHSAGKILSKSDTANLISKYSSDLPQPIKEKITTTVGKVLSASMAAFPRTATVSATVSKPSSIAAPKQTAPEITSTPGKSIPIGIRG